MKNLLHSSISSNFISTGTGLEVHYLESKPKNYNKNSPIALLLHGFPELSFSWRKIMPGLSNAGFRVIAPDQRGYGKTSGGSKNFKDNIEEYNLFNLTIDIISFLQNLNIKKIDLLVGHDAGSIVAGTSALVREDVFKSVVMMSAPYNGVPRINEEKFNDPIHEDLKKLKQPRKHYQWYYSTKQANRDMHLKNKKKLHQFLRSYFHTKSADWNKNSPHELKSWSAKELAKLPEYYIMKLEDTMVESVIKYLPRNKKHERWLNDDELGVYTETFFKNGFQSALNWYRCMTSNVQNKNLRIFFGKQIKIPSMFISGEKDWGMFQKPGALKEMQKKICKNFYGIKIVKNAGHWVQQEQPDAVLNILLKFKNSLK